MQDDVCLSLSLLYIYIYKRNISKVSCVCVRVWRSDRSRRVSLLCQSHLPYRIKRGIALECVCVYYLEVGVLERRSGTKMATWWKLAGAINSPFRCSFDTRETGPRNLGLRRDCGDRPKQLHPLLKQVVDTSICFLFLFFCWYAVCRLGGNSPIQIRLTRRRLCNAIFHLQAVFGVRRD